MSAAAATLLAVRPELRPEQVTALLERTAVDADGRQRMPSLRRGRDAFTGWGTLDVTAALRRRRTAPSADAFEPNDDAGDRSHRLSGTWRRRVVKATVDYWDDQDDVYAVYLGRVSVWTPRSARTPASSPWRSGDPGRNRCSAWRASGAASGSLRVPAGRNTSASEPKTTGWHYLQVRVVAAGDTPTGWLVVRS